MQRQRDDGQRIEAPFLRVKREDKVQRETVRVRSSPGEVMSQLEIADGSGDGSGLRQRERRQRHGG